MCVVSATSKERRDFVERIVNNSQEYEGAYRCDTVSNLTTGGCDNANIYNPIGMVDRAAVRVF